MATSEYPAIGRASVSVEHHTFFASVDAVRELRRRARAFAERHGAAAPDDVELAVSEAATNAVVHAYAAGEAGHVHLEASFDDRGDLLFVVCDEGRGMVPRPDSPGLGIGLPTVAQLAERFEVVDEGEGVRVRMSFRLRAATSAAA